MARVLEQLTNRRFLHYLTRVHDSHSIGDSCYDTEVVADEQNSGIHPILELDDEVEDGRLGRDIEASRWLIHNQQVWIARKRHRDHDALLLPSAQFVGIAPAYAFRICKADAGEKFHGAGLCSLAIHIEMVLENLFYLRADPHGRAERC